MKVSPKQMCQEMGKCFRPAGYFKHEFSGHGVPIQVPPVPERGLGGSKALGRSRLEVLVEGQPQRELRASTLGGFKPFESG